MQRLSELDEAVLELVTGVPISLGKRGLVPRGCGASTVAIGAGGPGLLRIPGAETA